MNRLAFRSHLKLAPDGVGTGAGSTAAGQGSPPASAGGGAAPPNGGAGEPWYAAKDLKLDDDTRKWIEGKNFKDPATALRSGREADTVARSRNVMDRPDPANLDNWKGWSELGWVEREDDYKLKRPQLRDGVQYDQAMEDHLRKIAHGARIPVGAAQKILDGLVDYQNKALDAIEAKGAKSKTELEGALKKEWGPHYEENRELSRRAARFLGVGMDDLAELEEIVGSAAQVKMFHRIGKLLSEDQLNGPAGAGGGTAGGIMSPQAAGAERRRLESDKAWIAIFNDQRHPLNKDYVARREELLRIEAQGKR